MILRTPPYVRSPGIGVVDGIGTVGSGVGLGVGSGVGLGVGSGVGLGVLAWESVPVLVLVLGLVLPAQRNWQIACHQLS